MDVDLETVQTNIVYFDVKETGRTAQQVAERLESQGVRLIALGPTRLRLVTHIDVDKPACEYAADVLRRVLSA